MGTFRLSQTETEGRSFCLLQGANKKNVPLFNVPLFDIQV